MGRVVLLITACLWFPESGVFANDHFCVELVTQQANCGGGISPIVQYLTNFAAQNSMGFELTQPPDTFDGGAAQLVQAPYLAFCLYGTTQGGLCGMRVKAYREDAMRDAMFNDDTTPVDSNPFLTGRNCMQKMGIQSRDHL